VLIEATILVPVLMTLMYGLFEFSWYFQKQQLVESGIRDAARYLARVAPETGTNPCTYSSPIDYPTNAQNIAVTGVTSGGTARVPGWTIGSVTFSCGTVNNSGGTYEGGPTIYIVTASTSFQDSLGFFSMLGLPTPNLTASHSERSVGPG
jgi:Flp pilus assembly protein TadG